MENEELVHSLRLLISGLHKSLRKDISESTSLSLTELETISLLYRNDHMLPTELANHTKVSTPSMTQILNKLAERKYIRRKSDPEDKRKVSISLTSTGKKVIENALNNQDNELRGRIESRLTAGEIKTLMKVLPILEKINSL
ncbi:MAG: MarR family transcriptional regulator [Bacteroidetes bacterium]|nr:MarR family transcriptional regulator [Bacteroidota bacterium]